MTLRANGAETTFDVRLELIKHIIRCVATGFDTQKNTGEQRLGAATLKTCTSLRTQASLDRK